VKKILIRGPNWIGDSVISIPALKAVRKAYPDAYLCLVLRKGAAELLKNLPFIDRIYLEGADNGLIRKEKFELGIILTNSFSSAFNFWRWGVKERVGYSSEHRGLFLTRKVPLPQKLRTVHLLDEYFQILKTAGIQEEKPVPEFYLPLVNIEKAAEILKKNGLKINNPLIGICPGASYGPAKVWPKERYLEIINKLMKEQGSDIVLFGGPKEQDIIAYLLKNAIYGVRITTGPAEDILTSAALIKKCDLFITNDTGPMHIAASLGVPVIAIFGSTNPIWTAPLGAKTKVLYKKVPCSPCYERICKKNKYECLTGISEEEVFNGIEEFGVIKKGAR